MRRAAKISCTKYSIKTKAVNAYLKFLRQTAKNQECYKVLNFYMFLRLKPKNYLIIFIFYGIL